METELNEDEVSHPDVEALGGDTEALNLETDCLFDLDPNTKVIENMNGEKLKRIGKKKVNVKQRTEPLSAYSFYVKNEKQKLDSKCNLNMPAVNMKWKSMTLEQMKPFIELSKDDKQSLGSNYRKNRKRTKLVKKTKSLVEDRNKLDSVMDGSQQDYGPPSGGYKLDSVAEPPSLSNMLEELKFLDEEINKKVLIKHEQSQKLLKLQIETEMKVEELSELDSSIKYYEIKCKVLKKESAS